MNTPLISVNNLAQMLSDPNLVILDASIQFQIPGQQDPILGVQLPNARRFDYEGDFSEQNSSLPHMMPSETTFNQHAQRLGLNNNSAIVVYDNAGTFASPRAWYMLKAMGHQQVWVLNGGLPAWIAAGHPIEPTSPYIGMTGDFSGQLDPNAFIDASGVLEHSQARSANIVDARSKARFHAQVPEPREGLRSGHIPTAKCLPFSLLLDQGQFHHPDILAQHFNNLSLDRDKPLIFSCGSGVTACILLLAADILRYNSSMVYDGSWTEWGARQDLPIEV